MLGSFIGDMVYKNNLAEKDVKMKGNDSYKIKITNITVEKEEKEK